MAVTALYHRLSQDTARAFQAYQVMRFLSVIAGGIVLVQLDYSDIAVGRFEWFIFGVHALSFFWAMGLKNALLSYYPGLQPPDRRKLFGGLFLGLLLVSILLAVLASVTGWFHYGNPLLFAAFFVFSVPGALSEQFLIIKEKSAELLHLGLWLHGLYLMAIIIGAWWYGSLFSVFVALTLWAFIRFCYTIKLMHRSVDWHLDMKVLKPFFGFALPLVLYILLGSGMDVIDGLIVEHFFEAEEFAKYRYGAKELPITALLIGALATATIPLAVENMDIAISELKQRLNGFMNWMFPLSIGLMLASPYLYSIFYSESYIVSSQIFNIYLLILVSRVLTPQVILYALKENKVLMWISAIELLTNLLLSLWLMSYFGIVGIAYATVIAYSLEKVLLWAYLKSYKAIPLSKYINVWKYIGWSVLLIASYLFTIMTDIL